MIRRRGKWSWIVAAALAGVPAVAGAQHYVGGDGRALDASNRLGSAGLNEPVVRDPTVTGNEIITGNVTGGRQFRDQVFYTDPRAFRGATAGAESDRFIRHSAGAPTGMAPQTDLTQVQPFFGESRAVQPPPGYIRQGFTGGYTPAQPRPVGGTPDDWRFTPPDAPQVSLPRPGQLLLPGQVDPGTDRAPLMTASPIYGVREWGAGDESQRFLIGTTRRETALDRLQIDDARLQQLRQELRDTVIRDEQPDAEENGRRPGVMPVPFDAPEDPAMRNGDLGVELPGRALAAQIGTDQRTRQHLLIPPARQQSVQHAEMHRRLARYRTELDTDQEAYRRFRDEVRRHEEAEARRGDQFDPFAQAWPGRPEVPADPAATPQNLDRLRTDRPAQAPMLGEQPLPPLGQPRLPGTPGQVDPQRRGDGIEQFGIPDYVRRNQELMEQWVQGRTDEDQLRHEAHERLTPRPPAPVRVQSLAAGVQATGLRELLERAEGLMQEGRYTTALDQYDAAEQVAPNNMLIRLGRAHAELGAGYYARAEANLRQALMNDPALLMGQYDLRGFLGEERLQTIVRDLQRIAREEPGQARPVFLLAYISYNTGNERRAAGYIDLAEQRAEGQDPLYPLVREHWLFDPNEEETGR